MSVFADYSNYYDLLYQDKDYAAEVEYIHELIQAEKPGAKTILNLGCGTGKHDFLLAEKGYKIHAIDLSPTMISIAEANNPAPEHIKFDVCDIRNFETNEQFDVVLSLFHVMSYQVENDDLKKAFSTANKHLAKNGVFIFDCWYGPGVTNDPPEHRVKEVQNDLLSIHRKTTPVHHEERHCVEVIFDIEITNLTSQETHTLQETHPMRYLFDDEIKRAAKEQELTLLHSYKWMTRDQPQNGDWYTVNVLR